MVLKPSDVGRLQIGPVQGGELGQEHRPEGSRSGRERPRSPVGHPRAQAVQAPACPGRLGYGPASDMHDLIGEAGDEQPPLVAGECVCGWGSRFRRLAAFAIMRKHIVTEFLCPRQGSNAGER